jgi:hypothetical protein
VKADALILLVVLLVLTVLARVQPVKVDVWHALPVYSLLPQAAPTALHVPLAIRALLHRQYLQFVKKEHSVAD